MPRKQLFNPTRKKLIPHDTQPQATESSSQVNDSENVRPESAGSTRREVRPDDVAET